MKVYINILLVVGGTSNRDKIPILLPLWGIYRTGSRMGSDVHWGTRVRDSGGTVSLQILLRSQWCFFIQDNQIHDTLGFQRDWQRQRVRVHGRFTEQRRRPRSYPKITTNCVVLLDWSRERWLKSSRSYLDIHNNVEDQFRVFRSRFRCESLKSGDRVLSGPVTLGSIIVVPRGSNLPISLLY